MVAGFGRKLYASGYIEETGGERSGFQLTETGVAALKGETPVLVRQDRRDEALRAGLKRKRDLRAAEAIGLDPQDKALFETLRALRRTLAMDEGVAAIHDLRGPDAA